MALRSAMPAAYGTETSDTTYTGIIVIYYTSTGIVRKLWLLAYWRVLYYQWINQSFFIIMWPSLALKEPSTSSVYNEAPRFLTDHCTSVSDVAYCLRLRSASSHEVSVPRHRLSRPTYGRRAFAVAGLTVWNSLPEDMRDPEVFEDSYRQSLKTFLNVFNCAILVCSAH